MDGNAKQEVAEKLRSSSSVLVTVSKDPSVDQLAAALGLSLMLTKLGKHTTTVFSGKIPNTMEFLDPTRTFDKTVDGLRDFIISLDKDKADKLRYKVEDNVVKIFITPYKSKISEKDLNFSQGDFNVDLVVALGVHKRDDLDNAITSHGRILHDAAIITINSDGNGDGNLGAVDWTDSNASCLSEMLVSISEALEGGILDSQMSTAFLTGIVAATERFKNDKTSPKIMTMSAQLMAAGANQQLIASNLQIPGPNNQDNNDSDKNKPNQDGGGSFTQDDHSVSIDRNEKDVPKARSELEDDDLLADIETAVHAKHNKLNKEGRTDKTKQEDPAIKDLESELSKDNSSNLIDLEDQLKSYEPKDPEPPKQQQRDGPIGMAQSSADRVAEETEQPTMGGTFNATAAEAHDRLEADKNNKINKEILSHNKPSLEGVSTHGRDVPTSADLMKDLQEAREAVELAMNESDFDTGGSPVASQALNAAPMPLDEAGGDMNMQVPPSMPNNFQPTQMPQPQVQNGYQQPPQMPQMQQPFNNGMNNQGPMNMQPPQMPQQMGGQPQQPMGNPMFNLPQQPQFPANGGNGQMGPPPNAPPPLPPNQPPPMPPFN